MVDRGCLSLRLGDWAAKPTKSTGSERRIVVRKLEQFRRADVYHGDSDFIDVDAARDPRSLARFFNTQRMLYEKYLIKPLPHRTPWRPELSWFDRSEVAIQHSVRTNATFAIQH